LTDDKNRSEVDAVIEEVKHELRSLFGKSKEQIMKVGNAFKGSGFKEESICELIKNALKEEITEGLISSRSIELHCPPEWKRKTKPKSERATSAEQKNEKSSFSKPVEDGQPQIAVTHTGKSVIMNSNTETYPIGSDGVIQPQDQSKQNGTGTDDNNEEGTGDADSKKESDEVTPSLNYNTEISIKKPEDSEIDTQNKVFDFHFSMLFEELAKDMAAVFKITQGIGKIRFEGRFDLDTGRVTVDFCGHRQQKNDSITSKGDGRILDR
jgi:hypothetical protein